MSQFRLVLRGPVPALLHFARVPFGTSVKLLVWCPGQAWKIPEEFPGIQGAKAPHPWPQPADGVVILEPFGSDRRGPKHTRAEQEES
jgi:hypothetical protein